MNKKMILFFGHSNHLRSSMAEEALKQNLGYFCLDFASSRWVV